MCFHLLSTEIPSGGEADVLLISSARISLVVMQLGTCPRASCTHSRHWASGFTLQSQEYMCSETGIQGTVRHKSMTQLMFVGWMDCHSKMLVFYNLLTVGRLHLCCLPLLSLCLSLSALLPFSFLSVSLSLFCLSHWQAIKEGIL